MAPWLHMVAAACTTGDEDNTRQLKARGVKYVEVPNMPLGAKHNAALTLAGDAPRYMVLPSDDFISREWFDVFMGTDLDYVSPDRCGVYDMATGRAKVLVNAIGGRRNFGAGRIFSRAVVDALGGKVWTDGKMAGLDTDSHARITGAGFECVTVPCAAIPITDVKSDGNLWGYDVFKGMDAPVSEVLHMVTWAR